MSEEDKKPEVSASNPSLPPEGSDVSNDGRTATGASVGAPAAPASGEPTKAPNGNSAAIENQTNVNAGTGAQVIGTVPDRVTLNQYLSNTLNDLESLITRIKNTFGVHFEHDVLVKHLEQARNWTAKEIGLERTADGGWVAAGTNQPAATSGQTDQQKEKSE